MFTLSIENNVVKIALILILKIFLGNHFALTFPDLAFVAKWYFAGSRNLYFRMTGLLQFNDKFEIFVFVKVNLVYGLDL